MGLRQRFAGSGLPRTAWVLSLAGFLVAVGFGVVIPVLTPFARTIGATSFQVGLVVSGFAAVRLVTSPFATRIGHAIGERNTITVGMLVVAASTVGTAVAPDITTMLVVRSAGGFGSAIFTVAAMNLLLSSTPEHLRGRASGIYQGGFLLGSMGGPAIGGLLAVISLTAPFYFYAVMLVLAAGFTLAMLPARAVPMGLTGNRKPPRFLRVIRDIRYQTACVIGFGQGWMGHGVRSAMIPIFVTESLRMETTWTGVAFAVAAVFQTAALIPAGNATDRRGRRPVMIASGLITGVSTLLLTQTDTIWLLIALLSLYGIGAALQGTAPTAAVGDATMGRGGLPVAAFSMVIDVGAIIGPLVAGALLDAYSFDLVFVISGIILLVGSVVALFIPRDLDLEFLRSQTDER